MLNQMKVAMLHSPGNMRIDQIPIPDISALEVLIKVKCCGICGTDPHIYEGTFPVNYPLVPGHEFSGEVVKVGCEVTSVDVGDRVTADINISCGTCFYCRTGQRLLCSKIHQIGVHENGAFAEYVKAPAANIYKLPSHMTWEEGAYIEPLACAIRGQERAKINMGSTVAIIGAGSMGLLHALLAKLNGASTVIITELNPARLQKARDLGIDCVVDGAKQDPLQVVLELTDGRGADFVFEAVGSIATYKMAFEMVRRGGAIVAFGAAPAGATMEVQPFDIFSKELTIIGSYAGTYSTWLEAIHLIASRRVLPSDIITKRSPLDDIPNGIVEAMTNKDTVKIVMHEN